MLKKLGFSKGLKNISIDSNSHILLKNTNLKLVVLRPNDLGQMGDLIGQGNKDIITWIGKTVGRNIAEATEQTGTSKTRKDFINRTLKNLEYLGFGLVSLHSFKDNESLSLKVENPLYDALDENQEIISTVYLGVFLGILEHIGMTVTGMEKEAGWRNEDLNHSLFEFTIVEAQQ